MTVTVADLKRVIAKYGPPTVVTRDGNEYDLPSDPQFKESGMIRWKDGPEMVWVHVDAIEKVKVPERYR